jgi:hypothetical protein
MLAQCGAQTGDGGGLVFFGAHQGCSTWAACSTTAAALTGASPLAGLAAGASAASSAGRPRPTRISSAHTGTEATRLRRCRQPPGSRPGPRQRRPTPRAAGRASWSAAGPAGRPGWARRRLRSAPGPVPASGPRRRSALPARRQRLSRTWWTALRCAGTAARPLPLHLHGAAGLRRP